MLSIAGAVPYTASLSVFVQLKESKNFRRQKSLPPTTSLKKNSELRTARHAICGQIRKSSAEEVCACQGAVTKCKKSHICTDHKLTKATSTPDEFENCVFV